MQISANKLDQLTSLRFFAALMIVIHHSEGLFGITNIGINFGQGVSFFFVLSGFILTYVYPKLETWLEIKRFWRARVARIWPAYCTSFLLGLWLLNYSLDSETAAANLFMVQAWVPLSTYYFSYNAVAWSVSTECFFYLAFPLILYKWNERWMLKVIFSGAILISILALSNLLSVPDYGSPLVGSNGLLVTQHGLIYVNPLSRIFEFIFGMCIALVWRRRAVNWTPVIATTYELGAVILCVISMYSMNFIAEWSSHSILGASVALWVMHCGSMFAFGLLIYVMSRGFGKVSEALAHPFLVILGEISFSLYLIHQILLNYYRDKILGISHFSNSIQFIVFIIVLLLSSYLIWTFIEMPGRRLIIGKWKIHGTTVMRKSWQDHLALSWKALLAGIFLCCTIGFIYFSSGNLNFISQDDAVSITPASLKGYTGTNFGNLFTLRGLSIQCEPAGLNVKLAWESNVDQKLNLTNAIHLIDGTGKILRQADYKQSNEKENVRRGDIWLDTLLVPANKLNEDTKSVAIGLYDDSNHLLLLNRDNTDWDGHRLVVPLKMCSEKLTNSAK